MPTSVSATDFRVNFTRLLPEVKAGGTVNITKHGKTIARLMPGNVIATPNDTISATAVRVKFKSLIARLSAGETFHITKHKNVLASLAFDARQAEMIDLKAEIVRLEDELDTSASTPGFSPSGYRLDTLTPITPEDAAMSDALADIEASEPDIDEVETSEADIVDIDVATPVTPVGDDDHLDTLTMKELHSFANKHNITIPPRSRKSEVKAAIRADMVDMKIDDHDWLDEEHDDDYDALFADLADRSELRRQRRNTTV
jgi:prevent-host-death family protein